MPPKRVKENRSNPNIQNAVKILEDKKLLTDEIRERLASIDFAVEDYFHTKDGTVKRPMNKFMVYAQSRRGELARDPRYKGLTTGKISQILKREWDNEIPEEVAHRCADKADVIKQVHQILFPDYVYRRRPNNWKKEQRGIKKMNRTQRSVAGPSTNAQVNGVPQQQYAAVNANENFVQEVDFHQLARSLSRYHQGAYGIYGYHPAAPAQFHVQQRGVDLFNANPALYQNYGYALNLEVAPPEPQQVQQQYPMTLPANAWGLDGLDSFLRGDFPTQ